MGGERWRVRSERERESLRWSEVLRGKGDARREVRSDRLAVSNLVLASCPAVCWEAQWRCCDADDVWMRLKELEEVTLAHLSRVLPEDPRSSRKSVSRVSTPLRIRLSGVKESVCVSKANQSLWCLEQHADLVWLSLGVVFIVTFIFHTCLSFFSLWRLRFEVLG